MNIHLFASHFSAPHPSSLSLLPLFLLLLTSSSPSSALFLQGTPISHLRYPKWNACHNASLYFEFRTTQRRGLLLYTDDGGEREFVEVSHEGGRVTALIKLVREGDNHVDITLGREVNDGKWHRVELRRNGMQTTLIVDGMHNG